MKHYAVKGADQLELDFPAFKVARDAYVKRSAKRLNGIYEKNVKKDDFTYCQCYHRRINRREECYVKTKGQTH